MTQKKAAVTAIAVLILAALLQGASAASANEEILVDTFALRVGESHQIKGYDAYITAERIDKIYQLADIATRTFEDTDKYQVTYTITGTSPVNSDKADYSSAAYENGSAFRVMGFLIAAEKVEPTAAHFIITRDSDLIAKEHCNNGVFEATDVWRSSNGENANMVCSADTANAAFPIKIKEITVDNAPIDVDYTSRKQHLVRVRIKNEGGQAVTLDKTDAVALFTENLLNDINSYNIRNAIDGGYKKEFDGQLLLPGEEYTFSYKYPAGYTFFPNSCGQEVMTGLAYLNELYDYGTYGGKAFAFNRVAVRCLSGGYEYPEKKPPAEEKTGIGYPGLSEAQECGTNWQCPEGLKCFGFPRFGPRCAKPEPCSYFNCLKGTSCAVLESYPPQVVCACTGPECQGAEGNENTAVANTVLARGVLETAKATAHYNAGLLFTEDSKLYMQMPEPAQKKQVNVMPEEAISVAESNTGIANASDAELIAESGRPVYVIKAKKKGKLLSLFPVAVEFETRVDAEKGEILSAKKPWWSFMVR